MNRRSRRSDRAERLRGLDALIAIDRPGAIVIAKANLHELAFGRPPESRIRARETPFEPSGRHF